MRANNNHLEATIDDPADDAKQKFIIDVYNLVFDTIVSELKTRFNDITVGVLKALQSISPIRFLDKMFLSSVQPN